MIALGVDTSNYTTSAALYDGKTGALYEKRRLLKVKPGELGLRQSDAVFQHTLALPELLQELFAESGLSPDVIGVSVAPRDEEGSYMPCFMAGKGTAESIGAAMRLPVSYFSHQAGHIAAALYSAGKLDWLDREFLAFHVSGGTTEAVIVAPDKDKIIKAERVAGSLDLKAGQAIDRVGVMLGLPFPAGPALDALSRESDKEFHIKPYLRNGDCSLSGIQNQCERMKAAGEPDRDIARYCIEAVCAALRGMTLELRERFPGLPLLYSGGVTSNSLIRERFTSEFQAVFAAPGFSSDNAVGIAVLASCSAAQ
ncbi:MAG: peptidase M22 [Clostridia bacterium]|nr:peptidase M22 [Clostridia bacterium]